MRCYPPEAPARVADSQAEPLFMHRLWLHGLQGTILIASRLRRSKDPLQRLLPVCACHAAAAACATCFPKCSRRLTSEPPRDASCKPAQC